jgi:hypothetical protein
MADPRASEPAFRPTQFVQEPFADKEKLLRDLLADVYAQARERHNGQPHPRNHDLTDAAQLHRVPPGGAGSAGLPLTACPGRRGP